MLIRPLKAQANALEALANQYRWQVADLQHRPLGMEIGFGMGLELIAWAEQRPNWRLLGVELYQPGIGSMLSRLAKNEVANVRLVDQPAQLPLGIGSLHIGALAQQLGPRALQHPWSH